MKTCAHPDCTRPAAWRTKTGFCSLHSDRRPTASAAPTDDRRTQIVAGAYHSAEVTVRRAPWDSDIAPPDPRSETEPRATLVTRYQRKRFTGPARIVAAELMRLGAK